MKEKPKNTFRWLLTILLLISTIGFISIVIALIYGIKIAAIIGISSGIIGFLLLMIIVLREIWKNKVI